MVAETIDSMLRSISRLGCPSRILVSESLSLQLREHLMRWYAADFLQKPIVAEMYFRGVLIKTSESLEGDEYAFVMGGHSDERLRHGTNDAVR